MDRIYGEPTDCIISIIISAMAFASQENYSAVSHNRDVFHKWNFIRIAEYLLGVHKGINFVAEMQKFDFLPTSRLCGKCGASMTLYQGTNYRDGCRWVCRKRNRKSGRTCNHETSVRAGTMFSNSRLKMEEMVILIINM